MADRNKLTSDDLHLLLEELMGVRECWYRLGLQLKVRIATLDRIKAQFSDSTHQLLEVLKTWLTDSDNTSWKTLTDALRSRSVGKSQLAADLEAKYKVEETEVHEKGQMSASRKTQPAPTSLQGETQMRNKLTLDDLGLLLEELMDVCRQWEELGSHFHLGVETLGAIIHQQADNRDRLLEMLKTWLTTSDNTSWKALTDALRRPRVRANGLAGGLERTYCLPKDMLERNILTLDDLGLLLEELDHAFQLDELVNVRERWYLLGLQLKVSTKKLDRIRAQFPDPEDQLPEMLKTWLTTGDNTSWKALTDAVKSRIVGGYQIADYLESKYCSMKDTNETVQSPPDLSEDDSTPLEAQMSPSRETQPTPLSPQEETQMSENPAVPISLKQILKDTKEVTSWFFLGIHLNIPNAVLKQLEMQYIGDPERRKTEVIDIWLHNDPEPTWSKLAKAVEDMGGHANIVEILRANHEGVPLISKVPVTSQDKDKSVGQQAQEQFGFRKVQLIKTEQLGTGSYGAVYKAMCDDLPCAGKILHPTLIQSSDPGTTIMKQFQQECSVLGAIRHPNIVQYLGPHEDPDTRLPVLLMELMDDSLTQFLERSQEPLPYHTQVNLCHDIALALSYLHSNDIIHRDLSGNNVLLIGAGNRAKVTDFGMAKLFNINRATMTPLTMCPGTLAYMSPEALDDPPVYTKKLDTFSFGVLGIQIMTWQFPDPGPRTKKVSDPLSPTGSKYVPVLETERRKSHIDLIDPTHPLLLIAIDCLSYNEQDRPSAQDLCHRLATLKQLPQYGDSVQQAQERSRAATADKEDRQKQLGEQQKQIQELQEQLQVHDGQVKEKNAVIATREQQLEQVTVQFQQDLLQREKMIQDLEEEKQHLRQELDKVSQQQIVTHKGSVHGVEVAGEVEFTVSTEGGSFHWEGYGLRLHVPKDSLPAGMGECKINIRVSLSGQFQLPEGTDLLSPVFWISAPCKFTKPVMLEIQHCALAEDEAVLSNLSFVSANCSQKDLPYRFKQVSGGVFTTHSAYGSIKLKHFSGVGVTGNKETPRSYCAHLYNTMKQMHWRFYFVIMQDLDAKNTVVRERYGHFSQEATLRVRFECSEITLDIPPDGLVTTEGWRITPLTGPTITKKDVDQFKKGRWIPECQLVVQWERKDQKPVQLRHKVILTGAEAPYNFIYLFLDPAEPAGSSHLTSPSRPAAAEIEAGSAPTMPELLKFTCADSTTINITKEIGDEYKCFGIFLLQDLNGQKVKSIKSKHQSDPSQINTEIFEEWLAGKGKQPVTWATLVEVLRDTELYSLADVIGTVKCPNSEQ